MYLCVYLCVYVCICVQALRNRMARDATEYSKAQQLQFIEATLANSTADWLFVVGHYPVYSGGSHGNTAELIQVCCCALLPPLATFT